MRTVDTSPRGHPGVTLTEVILASAIGSLLVLILYGALSSGQTIFRRGTDLSEAMTGALLVAEVFQADLDQIKIDVDNAGRPVSFQQDGRGMLFEIADPARADHREVVGEPVIYQLEPAGLAGVSHFARNDKVFRHVFLKKLQFDWFGLPDEDPHMMYVRMRLVATDRYGKSRFALVKVKDLAVAAKRLLLGGKPEELTAPRAGKPAPAGKRRPR